MSVITSVPQIIQYAGKRIFRLTSSCENFMINLILHMAGELECYRFNLHKHQQNKKIYLSVVSHKAIRLYCGSVPVVTFGSSIMFLRASRDEPASTETIDNNTQLDVQFSHSVEIFCGKNRTFGRLSPRQIVAVSGLYAPFTERKIYDMEME